MQVVNKQTVERLNAILTRAEDEVELLLGSRCALVLMKDVENNGIFIASMIARAMGMKFEDFAGGRRRTLPYVTLKQVTCIILHDCFDVKLAQIARITGYKDHTMAIYGIEVARKRIFTKDVYFCEQYKKAMDMVNQIKEL